MNFYIRCIFLFLLLGLHSSAHAGIERYYKSVEERVACSKFRNIDCVYLINLDYRRDKLEYSLEELAHWKIVPQRFSAICGWDLKLDDLKQLGIRFEDWMWYGQQPVKYFIDDENGNLHYLNVASVGETFFYGWISKGAIGCTLSHLSVLNDALQMGYDAIWVLEDDISISSPPEELCVIIDELNALVGEKNWDVLFTDNGRLIVEDHWDIQLQLAHMWRPDMPYFDVHNLVRHEKINDHLLKIGGRGPSAASIVYSRRGIEKILEFYRNHQIFIPYDHEICMIPDLNKFTITSGFSAGFMKSSFSSDTITRKNLLHFDHYSGEESP